MSDTVIRFKDDDIQHLGDIMEMGGEALKIWLKGKAGEEMALYMRSDAWKNAPWKTGTMRQMIDTPQQRQTRVQGETVSIKITAHAYYTIFQEYGTYGLGDPVIPHVPAESTGFQPAKGIKKGEWELNPKYGQPGQPMWVYAIAPQRFMRGAVYNNVDNFKAIIAKSIKEIYRGKSE